MAADVSSLLRILSGYKDDRTVANETVAGKSTALITRDLLGGGVEASAKDEPQELDLDLRVPTGWEKRLDLKVFSFSFVIDVCLLRKYEEIKAFFLLFLFSMIVILCLKFQILFFSTEI